MFRRPLEKAIERATVLYAKERYEVESVKLNGLGKRSHPDRMFLGQYARVLFVEFKRPGEKPTPLQLHLHRRWWRLYMQKVHVIDNVKAGRALIDKHFAHYQKPAGRWTKVDLTEKTHGQASAETEVPSGDRRRRARKGSQRRARRSAA